MFYYYLFNLIPQQPCSKLKPLLPDLEESMLSGCQGNPHLSSYCRTPGVSGKTHQYVYLSSLGLTGQLQNYCLHSGVITIPLSLPCRVVGRRSRNVVVSKQKGLNMTQTATRFYMLYLVYYAWRNIYYMLLHILCMKCIYILQATYINIIFSIACNIYFKWLLCKAGMISNTTFEIHPNQNRLTSLSNK